jgi:hypothetical protein
MSYLRNLLQHKPGAAFASQYALVHDSWNSLISFHNYFDEVFPGEQIAVRLELVFHDTDGRETLIHEVEVAPSTSIIVDCKVAGSRSDGIVAVRALPQADLHVLAEGRFKIRTQLGTGFYVTWEWDKRFRDTMHEWTDVSTSGGVRSIQHIGFVANSVNIEHGVLLTNPSTRTNQTTKLDLSLHAGSGSRIGKTVSLPPLPAMGSRIVKMSEVFPNFNALLAQHERLVLGVNSDLAAPPLTAEWHPSGDFHFHHI